ncbi:peptidoglycan DD-metalloendopeptidase family protein [Corynebacterium coyleae]|uniref:peptidoglycan DD-metalloendopeptidase family protein n=1 Tax=Corynebacterium coyleae TaxID=53374 RepID=UPI001CC96ED1|nr:peptidoglycan DD-metalloendopeptidase family protein [Corynebacterium coyleae]UBI10037.1 peptidoglycan DD-metalloendopeptidase family protein [Corynebacterium coyleae]
MTTMPVPKGFKVTSPFGPRWGTTHWGTDYGNGRSANEPVYAVKDGTVTRAGAASGFGQWVTIDHPASNGGGETVYGHIIPEVRVGQKVVEGQRIGRINGNKATNGGVDAHLHFEWHRYSWVPPGPNRLDPEKMLAGARWVGDAKSKKGLRPNPAWRGDPTFLPRVLRAFGVEVKELDGWLNRGHGDFGAIQGIVVHHIGSNKYSPWGIARHPSLGLCSQIHLSREGVATLCGAGIAYHAGLGSKPGWPTNNANWTSIGIEAEGDGITAWPEKQLEAYYKVCAAILWFLGKRATTKTLISHWEYSYRAQGKWDPGAGNGRSGAFMNMDVFRARVNAIIDKHEKGEDDVAFDNIETRYKSRVTGSNVTMRPIDALLNADAHSFVTRANTEKILEAIERLDRRIAKLEGAK